ncbi:MAG TPA: mandelate racemase/muconate lactonizing enzyme family protein [Chloroflexota bacterium]|jgi:L-alanine-DL-glutamate epimerase-like enolase superfamily enzyme|nr:mandelate racemase/muconate lactonizing enzyme family protein [Chloroflexota bacterium]
MKITDITVTEFSLGKLKRPYWNSIIRTTSKGFSRVEVRTDEGITGMSFGGARSHVTGRFKELLVGQDPLNAEACWERLYSFNRKPVAKGEYINAIGVLDIALWDLRGKALNQPCWKLLGGHRQTVPVYAAGGYYEGDGAEDEKGVRGLVEEIEGFLKHGYKAVKMKVGWPGAGLRGDQERVRAVREAIGPEIDLMIDVNNAWDANTAIKFGRMIEQYEPYWLEEPTPADDYRGQREICRALDTPVASGENEFTRWGFRDLIEAEAVDIVQADPRTCGGFTEWVKIAALASAYHLKMAPHGGPHVGAHCVGAVGNGLIVESYVHSIQGHLNEFVEAPDIRDGVVRLPERPGLGLVWHEEAIKKRVG